MELHTAQSITLISTGGRLNANTMSYRDFSAAKFLSQYNADISFVSCIGLHLDKGICDANESEAEMRRLMLRNAKLKVLTADNSKFNKMGLTTVAGYSSINRLITDKKLPFEWTQLMERHRIEYDDHEVV